MEAILSTATTAPWGKGLDNAGVPCGLGNTYGQMFDDPQGQHW
jgi:crotonobetainyl-CoA:carnitine CoA-transferase CaiB-like acyl-CoA transferase